MHQLLIKRLSRSDLTQPNSDQGFTLIELLIVVVIIGILAAIAIPNLLSQVGKARESEAKTLLGAVNRAQQGYFSEHSDFARTFDNLEISFQQKYYDYILGSTDELNGMTIANGKANPKNGTRSYAAGIQYSTVNRQFSTVLCRSKIKPNYHIPPLAVINNGIVNDQSVLQCDLNNTQLTR